MTSPPFVVETDRHTGKLTEFLKNLTLPSARAALTPPGCLLLAETMSPETDD